MRHHRTTIYRALAAALLLAVATGPAAAAVGYSFGDTDGKNGTCPDCHSTPGKIATRSFIEPVNYGQTTHARIGCPSCHDGVTAGEHGPGSRSARSDCRACHGEIMVEYAVSAHSGKASCTGCHDPHRVKSPLEISGQEINRMCGSCHDSYRMMTLHSDWLPQADLHLEMLPCVTCHTSSRNYQITLYLVKRRGGLHFGKFDLATYEELKNLAEGGEIVSLVDGNGDGYVSLAELRNFNTSHQKDQLRLKGMMTPEKVTHSFSILDNRRDCSFCHASGPGAMQTSFLAVPTAQRTLQRIKVEKGAVMDALYATPDFYVTGATRSDTLNKIGGLIIAGGLVMPVGHGFLRFATRKNRRGKGEES